MKKIYVFVLVVILSGSGVFAQDFGAKGAAAMKELTIEDMLKYAIQDEYLALTEYQALVKDLKAGNPYINIIESEKTHIKYLEDLYAKYKYPMPDVNTDKYLYVPKSLKEAAEIGVEAEIHNIAMYEEFLKYDLPDDIREVFEFLMNASKNHLTAFKRQL